MQLLYLQWQTQGLLSGSGWGQDGVQSFNQALAVSVTVLTLDLPALEPGHLLRHLQHVVSVPAGDGDESNGERVVTDLLDVARHFLLDFLKTGLQVKEESP